MFRPNKRREPGTTKAVVSTLIDEAGGVKRAAVQIGVSTTQLYAYAEPGEADEIKFDQVRRLVLASGATAPAEDLAALAGGTFLPIDSSCESIAELSADSVKDHAELTSAILLALADGKVDQNEARTLLPRVQELVRVIVCAQQRIAALARGDDKAGGA